MFGPLESQCTYRCVVLPDILVVLAALVTPWGLNAPTGAWCSLTGDGGRGPTGIPPVSMHLQVRGAP